MANTKVKGLLADLQKRYGAERVMMGSDITVGPPISTGSLGAGLRHQLRRLPQ